MKILFLLVIRFYRYFIDPLLYSNCRFYPTCSYYSEGVLKKYSFFYSFYLIFKRIIRCNPFCSGGYDPVP